jgi:hypothetical protein
MDPSIRHPLLAALSGRLLERLGAHLPAKIGVLLGLTVGICVPYFALQRVEVFPAWTQPVTRFDRWVAFDPGWVWAYQSLGLLVPIVPLLAVRREELVRYAKGLALLCGTCFAVFLLVPVHGPRPGLLPDHGMYRLLIDFDRPANSLPSLHAGLTVYTFLCGYWVLREELGRRARAVYAVAACLWTAVILYATLATKQHWAMDLPPGALAAWIAYRWAWRPVAAVPAGERARVIES